MYEFVKGVHLVRTVENRDDVARLAERYGEPVGVGGVLDDLNRQATAARAPGRGTMSAFAWERDDIRTRRWYPQGITTSADADQSGDIHGRRLIVTSWYSKGIGRDNRGSRISIIDLDTLKYRHVLVVTTGKDLWGRRTIEPLEIHAGGVVWAGDYLHLAGTRRGIFSAHVDDIMRVQPHRDTFGYRYVLPVSSGYEAHTEGEVEQLRYSFMSLDRGSDPPSLVAGEYGVSGQTTRLVRYPLDPDSMQLYRDEQGNSRPVFLDGGGVGHMQGAAVVGDDYYVTVSRGRWKLGHLYVGKPGSLRAHRWMLPPGPEDISYWPARDQFWSLSEHPGRRWVFAIDRTKVLRQRHLRLDWLPSPGNVIRSGRSSDRDV